MGPWDGPVRPRFANRAAAALGTWGGEIRLAGARTYVIDAPIGINSYTRFIGQGTSTKIVPRTSEPRV